MVTKIADSRLLHFQIFVSNKNEWKKREFYTSKFFVFFLNVNSQHTCPWVFFLLIFLLNSAALVLVMVTQSKIKLKLKRWIIVFVSANFPRIICIMLCHCITTTFRAICNIKWSTRRYKWMQSFRSIVWWSSSISITIQICCYCEVIFCVFFFDISSIELAMLDVHTWQTVKCTNKWRWVAKKPNKQSKLL